MDATRKILEETRDRLMQAPTIGRQLWFYQFQYVRSENVGPLAATVAKVISPTQVNLCVIADDGNPFGVKNVSLLGETDPVPKADYCRWPVIANPVSIRELQTTAAPVAPLAETAAKGWGERTNKGK